MRNKQKALLTGTSTVSAASKAHRKVVRPNPAYRPWPRKVKHSLWLAVFRKASDIIVEAVARLGWPKTTRLSRLVERLDNAAELLTGVAR